MPQKAEEANVNGDKKQLPVEKKIIFFLLVFLYSIYESRSFCKGYWLNCIKSRK